MLGVDPHEAVDSRGHRQDLIEAARCSLLPFGQADRGEFHADVRFQIGRSLRLEQSRCIRDIGVRGRPCRGLAEPIERDGESALLCCDGHRHRLFDGVPCNEALHGTAPPGGALHQGADRRRSAHPQEHGSTQREEWVHADLLSTAEADRRIDRFVDGPRDLADRLNGAGNKEIDAVAWSDAASSHHAKIGTESDDPLVTARVHRAELREDADLRRRTVIYLGAVEPGKHRAGRPHPVKVCGIHPLGIEPLEFNKLFVWNEDFEVERTKASRYVREDTALPFVEEGAGKIDLHALSFAERRVRCSARCTAGARIVMSPGVAWP